MVRGAPRAVPATGLPQRFDMSEFSISFHIRANDSDDVEARFLRAKLSGLVFGPANGWLTFVPYGGANPFAYVDGDWFAENLSNVTGCPCCPTAMAKTMVGRSVWCAPISR